MKKIYLYSEVRVEKTENLSQSLGYELIYIKDLDKISAADPVILVISEKNIEKINEFLEMRRQKVLLGIDSKDDFRLISKLINEKDKIFGFIDLTKEIEFNIPICLNYLNLNFSKHALSLSGLENDLNKILDFTKLELEKVKKIHQKIVKIRQDEFKGIVFTSKFMAGEKSGGEFFDFIDKEGEVIFLQLGSDSYYSSALLISEVEKIKLNSKNLLSVQVVDNFIQMIWNMAKEHKSKISYNIFTINKKSLDVILRSNGEGKVFLDGNIIEMGEGAQFKIKPKSKMLILSNGILKNWRELNPNEELESKLNKNNDDTKEQITEFFYELSKNKKGMFLTYDALVVAVEVSPNAIYQLN